MFEAIQIPINHIHNVGFDEVVEYVTMVNFQYVPMGLWTTTKTWNALPEDIQNIMTEVGREAAEYEIKIDFEDHLAYREKLKQRNTEIIDLTPAQMAEWVKASEPVYQNDAVTKHTPPDILNRLRAAAAN